MLRSPACFEDHFAQFLVRHDVAAAANCFGPRGVLIVRLADFPNAGLRSFHSWLALRLTLVGLSLFVAAWRTEQRWLRLVLIACWAVFSIGWFAVGLRQISDGLL